MLNSKKMKLVPVSIVILLILFMYTWWIIRPTVVALVQGDDWIGICKGVVELKSKGSSIVEISNNPMTYLEQTEGALALYLEQISYKVEYDSIFMYCNYWDKDGYVTKLEGHKCGSEYTIWIQE